MQYLTYTKECSNITKKINTHDPPSQLKKKMYYLNHVLFFSWLSLRGSHFSLSHGYHSVDNFSTYIYNNVFLLVLNFIKMVSYCLYTFPIYYLFKIESCCPRSSSVFSPLYDTNFCDYLTFYLSAFYSTFCLFVLHCKNSPIGGFSAVSSLLCPV